MTPPAYPHQIEARKWLSDSNRPRAMLADEAGCGKCRPLLESAIEPVLIVAPAMVINSGTWDDEIALWTPGIDDPTKPLETADGAMAPLPR